MASLIETLITTLQKENEEYETLMTLSLEKTGVIAKGDLDALGKIVEQEQTIVERVNVLEKKRTEVTKDIAVVLSKKPEELKLPVLIRLLEGQTKECEALKAIHDRLSDTMSRMVRVNEHNKALLQESIDMIQFEMNLIQSMKQAPATANYNGNEYADASAYGTNASFDAKQ